MPPPILDLTDGAEWLQVYDSTLTAEPITGLENRYRPIPHHVIPFDFYSYTLAIGASSSKAKPTWNLAFYLGMMIDIPSVGNAETEATAIRLGLSLVRFPPLAAPYKLKARIPRWHSEMSMTIWRYLGNEPDVLSLVNHIDFRTKEIDRKIDSIERWGGL